MPEWSDQEFLRTVFDQTRVIRTPLRGIIAGYHVLPYVLLGPPEYERTSKTVEVRGRIRVSPRLVLGADAPTYGQMFGERELMDARIVARVFSFRHARRVTEAEHARHDPRVHQLALAEHLAVRRRVGAQHEPGRHPDAAAHLHGLRRPLVLRGAEQDVGQDVVAGDDAAQGG